MKTDYANETGLIGGDGKKWPETFDAMVWAKEFVNTAKRIPSIATDEGAMTGWFANAIMRGWHERGKNKPSVVPVALKAQTLDAGPTVFGDSPIYADENIREWI